MRDYPKTCSLVAGVFNCRPPHPRYCFIWNVQIEIDFIKFELGQNGDLSDKYLTYKLNVVGSDLSIPGVRFITFRYMFMTKVQIIIFSLLEDSVK